MPGLDLSLLALFEQLLRMPGPCCQKPCSSQAAHPSQDMCRDISGICSNKMDQEPPGSAFVLWQMLAVPNGDMGKSLDVCGDIAHGKFTSYGH